MTVNGEKTVNADILAFLKNLGFTDKEQELYLCALRTGPQTASTLAKKTGIARSTVNFLFDQLIQRGFAHKERRENTSYFKVIQPQALEYHLLEKQAESKKNLGNFYVLLPALESLISPNALQSKVTCYDGLESLYRTIDDCCDEDETVLFVSSHSNMHPKLREYVERVYVEKSKKHKNKNQMIISDTPTARAHVQKAKGVYNEVIFVDPEKNPFKLTLAIHGDKVDFISHDERDLSGFIIENALVAEHMRTIFKLLKKLFKTD